MHGAEKSCAIFRENARDHGLWRRIVRVSRATERVSGNRTPLDEGGNSMSRLSSKIVVVVILGFTALTASGCTFPVTIDGAPGFVIQ